MNATPSKFRYKCSSCNELHDGLPDVTFARPEPFDQMSEIDRIERALINEDFCIIDGNRYFLRCIAEAPIAGYDEDFGWGLWAEVPWPGFKKVWEAYSYEEAPQELEVDGTIANTLQHYPETLGLACTVKLLDDGQRPHVAAIDTAHLLAQHQKDGLSLEEAIRQARTVGALLVVG
jgi:hypothetical protein